MGEVRAAWDPRLGREVAIKRPPPGDSGAAARLAREAALTARLEHPNIMPIYEAGRDPAGRPWYAMRLLAGRSLADALEDRALPERLALLRHLLGATEAMAYAHGQGVLHRDLKPANIMTGSFGETVVADWGLACTLEEAKRSPPQVGTPGYASPEQRRGGEVDARADVYSLGAVLYELLSGATPPAEGALPPLGPEAPAELAAIAERALRTAPAERYPSARALADDLLAWFEGRRVLAHEYSALELLQRFLRAWRLPLAVGAVGVVGVVSAVAFGWTRTLAQRERAEVSEQEALSARASERGALAAALLAQAHVAAEREHALEAEVLAAESLIREETPEARGVLARFAAAPRLEVVETLAPPPDCERPLLAPGRLLCLGEDGEARLYATDGRALGRVEGDWIDAALGGGAGVVLVDDDGQLHVWRPPEAPVPVAPAGLRAIYFGDSPLPGRVPGVSGSSEFVVDTTTAAFVRNWSCGPTINTDAIALSADGGRVVGCDDLRIVRVDPEGRARTVATLHEDDGLPSAVSSWRDEVLVGSYRGKLLRLGPDGEVRARQDLGEDTVRRLEVHGDRALVGLTSGESLVWDLVADRVHARMRAEASRVAWAEDGGLWLLDSRLERRSLPAPGWPHQLPFPAGIASVAFSPDGAELAVARGDGVASLVEVASGRVRTELRWQEGVMKDVAWSPDGTLLAAIMASTGPRVYTRAGQLVAARDDATGGRRATWTPGLGLVMAPYSLEVARWWPAEDRFELQTGRTLADLETDDRGHLAALDPADAVVVARDAEPLEWRPIASVRRAEVVAPYGAGALVATPDRLAWYDGEGGLRWSVKLGSPPIDVSTHGELVVVGHLDGSATCWKVGSVRPLARMTGHGARIGSVAVSPDGRWLATGGWDAAVRLWSLDGLEAPAAERLAHVTSAWGRGLRDVLGE